MFSPIRTSLRTAAGIAMAAALALAATACSDNSGGVEVAGGKRPGRTADGLRRKAKAGVDPTTTAAVDAPKPAGTVDMKDVLGPQTLEDRALGPKDAEGDRRRISVDDLPALPRLRQQDLRHDQEEIRRYRQGALHHPAVPALLAEGRPARRRGERARPLRSGQASTIR